MIRYQTLPEMLDASQPRRRRDRLPRRRRRREIAQAAELRRRALGILHHLQRAGAQPGDRLILHVASNEQFIDAYWACLYGGIVPVPVAVGISDEHKHKLLRIARQLGRPAALHRRGSSATVWPPLPRRSASRPCGRRSSGAPS